MLPGFRVVSSDEYIGGMMPGVHVERESTQGVRWRPDCRCLLWRPPLVMPPPLKLASSVPTPLDSTLAPP